MGDWSSVSAGQIIPPALTTAIQEIASLASTALSASSLTLAGIQLPVELPNQPSPLALAAQALLSSLQALVAGAKIHVIGIPIAKTVPAQHPPVIPGTLDDLQAWLDVSLGPAQTTANNYQSLVRASGGNAGFFQALSASLLDAGDPNRPMFFGQSDAIAAAVVMAGASSWSEITHAASLLGQLFQLKDATGDLTSRTVPTPKNLRAVPVGSPTGPRVAVKLDWDPPQPMFTFKYFPGISSTVNKYAVIRMTGATSRAVRSVLDLFPTQDLTVGMSTSKAKVVAIGSGANSTYLDADSSIDATQPAYYCVAWELKTNTATGGASTLKFDKVSNVAKVSVSSPPGASSGTPPDWSAYGSAADALPALGGPLLKVLERGKILAQDKPTPASKLSEALNVANDSAQKLAARASDLAADAARLSASLSRAAPSLYVTQMSSGTGGNAFLLAELSRRLSDLTDPMRPPFDNGEYVCGVVMVAGAPRLADLAAAIAFFEALFGSSSASNPVVAVINAIDTAVTQAEAAVFGPNLAPLSPGTVVDPATGLPPTESTPVTAADGTPTTGDAANNPNSGFTNDVPLSSLC